MGDDIQPAVVWNDGDDVTAATLNTFLAESNLKSTAITAKAAVASLGASDEFLVSQAGVLKKTSGQQVQELAASVPIGAVTDFAGTVAPTNWLMCYGQPVSRATYAVLFGVVGTAFGVGDGTSTFNLPDCRGRVSAGKDNMGGTSADRLTIAQGGPDGDVLGSVGGAESHTLATTELASHAHLAAAHVHNNPAHQHYVSALAHFHATNTPGFVGLGYGLSNLLGSAYNVLVTPQGANANTTSTGGNFTDGGYGATQSDVGNSQTNTFAAGGGQPHNNCQPTIIFNKIIRAL